MSVKLLLAKKLKEKAEIKTEARPYSYLSIQTFNEIFPPLILVLFTSLPHGNQFSITILFFFLITLHVPPISPILLFLLLNYSLPSSFCLLSEASLPLHYLYSHHPSFSFSFFLSLILLPQLF